MHGKERTAQQRQRVAGIKRKRRQAHKTYCDYGDHRAYYVQKVRFAPKKQRAKQRHEHDVKRRQKRAVAGGGVFCSYRLGEIRSEEQHAHDKPVQPRLFV